jgi:predicted GNAT superfamily acetyltransferase
MSSPASIRPLVPADLPWVQALNTEAVPAVSALSPAELRHWVTQATLAWVATTDEGVIGYLIAFASTAPYDGEEFTWLKSQVERFLHVDQVAVAARCHRRGVGTTLYTALERQALEGGYHSVTCGVNVVPPNPGSLAFHRRRGFRELGRLQTSEGPEVALLQKPLLSAV